MASQKKPPSNWYVEVWQGLRPEVVEGLTKALLMLFRICKDTLLFGSIWMSLWVLEAQMRAYPIRTFGARFLDGAHQSAVIITALGWIGSVVWDLVEFVRHWKRHV